MNADVIRKVDLCVVGATYEMMKSTGIHAKPPEYRAPSIRFRVPTGFDPDVFAEKVRHSLELNGVNAYVKMAHSKRWITVSYSKWKQEYTEKVRAKRNGNGGAN